MPYSDGRQTDVSCPLILPLYGGHYFKYMIDIWNYYDQTATSALSIIARLQFCAKFMEVFSLSIYRDSYYILGIPTEPVHSGYTAMHHGIMSPVRRLGVPCTTHRCCGLSTETVKNCNSPCSQLFSPSSEQPEQHILAYKSEQTTAGCIAIFPKHCCYIEYGGIIANLTL